MYVCKLTCNPHPHPRPYTLVLVFFSVGLVWFWHVRKEKKGLGLGVHVMKHNPVPVCTYYYTHLPRLLTIYNLIVFKKREKGNSSEFFPLSRILKTTNPSSSSPSPSPSPSIQPPTPSLKPYQLPHSHPSPPPTLSISHLDHPTRHMPSIFPHRIIQIGRNRCRDE